MPVSYVAKTLIVVIFMTMSYGAVLGGHTGFSLFAGLMAVLVAAGKD